MENAPYHFFFKKRHQTKTLLQKYVISLKKQEQQQYIQNIGIHLYQFEIHDKYSSWMQFLKHLGYQKPISQKYKNIQQQHKIQSYVDISQFQDKQFQLDFLHIQQQQKGSQMKQIPKYIVSFFEIYYTNIIKIASFKMYQKIPPLTKVKRLQNWCLGSEYILKRIIITKQGILQISNDVEVIDFLKFDLYFSFKRSTNDNFSQFKINLYSAHRKKVLKAINTKDFLSFHYYAQNAYEIQKSGTGFLGSCCPSSTNNINFLIDAQNYYRQVALEIQKATKTINITGWWISPQLYLIRPIQQKQKININFRLDTLLQRAAERNVKIYIIVFYSPIILPNDSDYTQIALSKLHQNIQVERHPQQFLPKLWSHHQKLMIIDQKIAFMGGLDLCYGRYDSYAHPININDCKMYPGIDYNNVRIKDFIQIKDYQKDLQQRTLPRMPWHDVSFKVCGKVVSDLANHFIQYWNFTLYQKTMVPIVKKDVQNRQKKQSLELSKKTQNLVIGILKMAIQHSTDLNNRQKYKIQTYIQNKQRKQKWFRKWKIQSLINKFELNNGPKQNGLILSIKSLGLLKDDKKFNKNKKYQTDKIQLLRSASEWSIGLENGVIQRSIQNAYLKLIHDSKYHIYIQNQFFISATGDYKNSLVSNQIANAIFQRIKRAISKKQKFKVVIFIPLLPAIEGSLDQKCPISLKLIMYWQYNTISQNKYSLIPRIRKLTDHPQDYIQFYSLRSHGLLNGKPVTELIYIHSKLMIIDDNIVICGSANINDRSLEGDRDSELAIVFTEGQKILKRLNGQYCQVNQKVYKLRSKLYRQHFGLTEPQVEDPLSQSTISKMRKIAQTNTETYRTVFGCCPDDNVKTLEKVPKFEKIVNLELYQQYKQNIIGHAVKFPTMFLSQQNLYTFKIDMIQDIFI